MSIYYTLFLPWIIITSGWKISDPLIVDCFSFIARVINLEIVLANLWKVKSIAIVWMDSEQ